MPHLSPMSWTLFLMLIWLMVMLWASINSHDNSPSFPLITTPKLASIASSWNWM